MARLFYSYVMDLLDGTKIETSFMFVLFLCFILKNWNLIEVQSKEFGGDPRKLIVPDVAPTVVTEFGHQGDDKE